MFGQQSEISTNITKINASLNEIEDVLLKIPPLVKAAQSSKSKEQINEYVTKINAHADKAQELVKKAENDADIAEKSARDINCYSAASEADDGEDYCRHMKYYTFEIKIYAQKALKESELSYSKNYLGKISGYIEDSYESLKNARTEFEDCLKDLQNCN
ncbi:MAG: hypothetical protein SFY32_04025 [Bacteroidota bacterium]|nr:hypothetical protein [Bacteroidota bacterium]